MAISNFIKIAVNFVISSLKIYPKLPSQYGKNSTINASTLTGFDQSSVSEALVMISNSYFFKPNAFLTL